MGVSVREEGFEIVSRTQCLGMPFGGKFEKLLRKRETKQQTLFNFHCFSLCRLSDLFTKAKTLYCQ